MMSSFRLRLITNAALVFLGFSLCQFAQSQDSAGAHLASDQALVLVGGTVVDLTNFGHSQRDIPNAAVVLQGGKILNAGPRAKIQIPHDARILDVSGKYILPGLVDGFASLDSQAQANAYLFMGVTTVVASYDDRRPRLFTKARPGPHIYLMDSAGSTDDYSLLRSQSRWSVKLKEGAQPAELSVEDTRRQLEDTARQGTRVIWVGHNITARNTQLIIARAHELGMITYGEFISTPYAEGLEYGIDVLMHMSRYEMGLLPEDLQKPLVTDPEGPSLPVAYSYIYNLDPADPKVRNLGRLFAIHHAALLPTFSLFYARLPGHRNLWKEPVATILDPKRMFMPSDATTGEAVYPPEVVRRVEEQKAAKLWALNMSIFQEHPHYLAASAASAFESMPGISSHTELELLVRLGLTPREALSAATSNYSEVLGWHELGLVAPGRRGDLLVVDADPTTDIHNSTRIASVILEGSVIERTALLKH
jgi:hypothetical protein